VQSRETNDQQRKQQKWHEDLSALYDDISSFIARGETLAEPPYQKKLQWSHNQSRAISRQEAALDIPDLTPEMKGLMKPLRDLRYATNIPRFQSLAREYTDQPVSEFKAAIYCNIGRESGPHTTRLIPGADNRDLRPADGCVPNLDLKVHGD
jgi:hypothetical protein